MQQWTMKTNSKSYSNSRTPAWKVTQPDPELGAVHITWNTCLNNSISGLTVDLYLWLVQTAAGLYHCVGTMRWESGKYFDAKMRKKEIIFQLSTWCEYLQIIENFPPLQNLIFWDKQTMKMKLKFENIFVTFLDSHWSWREWSVESVFVHTRIVHLEYWKQKNRRIRYYQS